MIILKLYSCKFIIYERMNSKLNSLTLTYVYDEKSALEYAHNFGLIF